MRDPSCAWSRLHSIGERNVGLLRRLSIVEIGSRRWILDAASQLKNSKQSPNKDIFKDDCPAEAHIMLQISAHPISKERTRPGHVIQRGHVQIQARYI